MRRSLLVLGSPIVATLAFATAAQADVTLGSTTQPTGSTAQKCGAGVVVAPLSNDPSSPYTVPAAGGLITQWQVNTTGAAAGEPVTLVALKALADGTFSVVASDTEHLPTPLPAGNLASFTPGTPLTVGGGDILGLYWPSNSPSCFWHGGSTPVRDGLLALTEPSAPAAGQALPVAEVSTSGYVLNLAATVAFRQDLGVTTTATPSALTVGTFGLLSSSVTLAGPTATPITFTDTVPAGLTIKSAVAGSGACTVTGQNVACTISGLSSGQTAPVNILVTPTAPGQYTNAVSVAPAAGTTDTNAANNTASAALTAVLPVKPRCTVPSLTRVPLSLARTILVPLNCKLGKVTHAFSNSIAKGLVIKTTPRAGSYPNATAVGIQVSSGRKPKNKRHR